MSSIKQNWKSTVHSGTVQLPQQYVDTAIDPNYDRAADGTVPQGGNLQTGLDLTKPGEILEIDAGVAVAVDAVLRET